MSLNTRLDGDPENLRAVARWLRKLRGPVEECVTRVRRWRDTVEEDWQDPVGEALYERLDNGGRSTAEFADDMLVMIMALEVCADGMELGQHYMQLARDVADEGNLTRDGYVIAYPQEPPAAPGAMPEDDAKTWQATMLSQLQATYQRAREYVDQAGQIIQELLDKLGRPEQTGALKRYFTGLDFINAEASAVTAWYEKNIIRNASTSIITSARRTLLADALRWDKGAPDLAELLEEIRDDADGRFDPADARAKAARMGLVSKVVDFGSGTVITAAGVAYDVHNGKPVDKAIISGSVGFAASLGAGAVGGMLAGSFSGPPGMVLAAGVGVASVLAGMGASKGADWGYDNWSRKPVISDPDYFRREYQAQPKNLR